MMVCLSLLAVGVSIGRAVAFGSTATGSMPQLCRSIAVPIFTALEIDIGITAASLPTLSALVERIKGRGIAELDYAVEPPRRAVSDRKQKSPQPKAIPTVYHYPLSHDSEPKKVVAPLAVDQKQYGQSGTEDNDPLVPHRGLTHLDSRSISTRSQSSGSIEDDEVWGIEEARAASRLERPLPFLPGSAL